jgi:HPt (histidine-containing phosphotransfer) domain-containing protein
MVQLELSSALPDMAEAFKTKKWEELHEIVHKLKSTLAFVGNSELTTINQKILSQLEQRNYQADYSCWLAKYKDLTQPIQKELIRELVLSTRVG